MELEELREYLQPVTTEETDFPDAKEVFNLQFIVKDDKLYIMIKGNWYLINNLTKV